MAASLEKQIFYSVIINGNIHNVTGRKRTPNGYIALCIRSHPNSESSGGYIFEHRVMMETLLNRYLDSKEIVHHKNGVKHDNRLGNLEVMDHTEHTVMHHKGASRSKDTKMKISEKAKKRYASKENHANYKHISKVDFMEALKERSPKKAAKKLGIARKTVYNKIKEFNLQEWYKND